MITYDELYDVVKSEVSEKRFNHILGVVKRAIEYAQIYNANIEDVKVAAILHDIAKEYSEEKSYEILEKYGYNVDEVENNNYNLIHSKVGSIIAKYEYGLSDDICNAIAFHTTGRSNMSMLEKIIYLADATEEGRNYKHSINELTIEEVVATVKEDIDKGLIYVLKWSLQSILRRDLLMHMNTVEAYNFYLDKMN